MRRTPGPLTLWVLALALAGVASVLLFDRFGRLEATLLGLLSLCGA